VTGRQGGTAALALLVVAAAAMACGPVDAWIDEVVALWRTCRGVALAGRVSDLVMPVGLSVVAVAVGRALWRGRPGAFDVLRVVVALAAGALLVGALKDFLDRPRPGAEFLGPGGGSYPSGHVANTVLAGLAALTLWWGGWPVRISRRGWLLLAVALTIIATARVYERRHWPSDTVAALAIGGAYGVLAILHPDARWRTVMLTLGLILAGLTHVAASHGIKVRLPASTAASRTKPVEHITFGGAHEHGLLRGDWVLDVPDPRRRSAWLHAQEGELLLPTPKRPVEELRLVARPRSDLGPETCERLRLDLNGRRLGEVVLQTGWRAYVFPITAADVRSGGNVLAFNVSSDGKKVTQKGMREAAFSELTLHGASEPVGR
jgi:membrane-associated phospholipid phosphatase